MFTVYSINLNGIPNNKNVNELKTVNRDSKIRISDLKLINTLLPDIFSQVVNRS